MQQTGEYRIGAPRIAVWAALNDPEVLARCIEGCQSMTRTADDAFEAVIKAKVGPVSATFTAQLGLTDLIAPDSYTLNAAVKGGAAGFGKGVARVSLTAEGDATLLRYEVEGSVGGKLAQVGQRLVDAAARKMADDFFSKFGNEVAPGEVTPSDAAGAGVPVGAGVSESSGRYVIWIIVFAVLLLAIVLAS
ncbi:MAG: carbon monoxide dehydrogenase subunit G [Gammaproteobacteria bacterium]|nr:carbon monoxide dehydrogenase subunit G [Gammaproteobacteria bacterium]